MSADTVYRAAASSICAINHSPNSREALFPSQSSAGDREES